MSVRFEGVTHATSTLALELVEGVSVVPFAHGEPVANGFSAGMARFKPGVQLGCDKHECGESIPVLQGERSLHMAVWMRMKVSTPLKSCLVQGDDDYVDPGASHDGAPR